jgi:hypothetical protein
MKIFKGQKTLQSTRQSLGMGLEYGEKQEQQHLHLCGWSECHQEDTWRKAKAINLR